MGLSVAQRTRLDELTATIRENLDGFMKVAMALAEVKRDRLWVDDYGSFEQFCSEEFNIAKTQGYQLAQAGEVVEGLLDSGMSELPTSFRQASELAKAPSPEMQREAWELTLSTGQPSGASVKAAVQTVKAKHQPITPGSVATVICGQHDGAEVTIQKVESNGAIVHCELPDSTVYPFMARELDVTQLAQPPAEQPRKSLREQNQELKDLLRRILEEGLTESLRGLALQIVGV